MLQGKLRLRCWKNDGEDCTHLGIELKRLDLFATVPGVLGHVDPPLLGSMALRSFLLGRETVRLLDKTLFNYLTISCDSEADDSSQGGHKSSVLYVVVPVELHDAINDLSKRAEDVDCRNTMPLLWSGRLARLCPHLELVLTDCFLDPAYDRLFGQFDPSPYKICQCVFDIEWKGHSKISKVKVVKDLLREELRMKLTDFNEFIVQHEAILDRGLFASLLGNHQDSFNNALGILYV